MIYIKLTKCFISTYEQKQKNYDYEEYLMFTMPSSTVLMLGRSGISAAN